MKVYVVVIEENGYKQIWNVFSNRELAERCIETYTNTFMYFEIEEFEVDQ